MDELNAPPQESRTPGEPPFGVSPQARQSPVFYGPNGLRAGWRLLIFLAVLSVLFSVAALAARLIFHRPNVHAGLTPVATLLSEGLPLLIVLLASWIMAKLERRTLADYGLPETQAFRGKFWLGGVMGFAAISVLIGTICLAGDFSLAGLALHGSAIWSYALLWAAVFVVVGLFEEFFFRGYSLFTLTTGIGFWPAAIALSTLFGYVHHGNSGENWLGAFDAGLVGLLFCLLLRRTGDLWMAIGFHAAWDWGETYFYGVADSGQVAAGHLFNARFAGPSWITGGTVGPEGSYFCAGLLVVLFILFHFLFRSVRYPAPAALERGHDAHLAIGSSPDESSGMRVG